MAAWLLQNKRASRGSSIQKTLRSCCSQMISLVVAAKALYSASAEDLEMVGCFFDFQEMSESPKKMQNLVTDFLESAQVAQYASENARNWKEEEARKNKP